MQTDSSKDDKITNLFKRTNESHLANVQLYALILCGGNPSSMASPTTCPQIFNQQIFQCKECPTCGEQVNSIDEKGEINPASSLVNHALVKHNPHKFGLDNMSLVDIARDTTSCPVCLVTYDNDPSSSKGHLKHLKLHATAQNYMSANSGDIQSSLANYWRENTEASPQAKATVLKEMITSQYRDVGHNSIKIFVPFKVNTLDDMFQILRKRNAIEQMMLPFYITKQCTSEQFRLFNEHYVLHFRLNGFESSKHVSNEKRSRTNFAKYLLLAEMYMHFHGESDIFNNVKMRRLGNQLVEDRLRKHISWLHKHDIEELLRRTLEDRVTFFCSNEFVGNPCNNPECDAFVHSTDLYFVQQPSNSVNGTYFGHSSITIKWGSFFNSPEPQTLERMDQYVNEIWFNITLMRQKLVDYAYVMQFIERDTNKPEPSLKDVHFEDNPPHEITAPYKLYAGFSQCKGYSRKHVQKRAQTRIAKMFRQGFKNMFFPYDVKLPTHTAEFAKAVFRLFGFYCEVLNKFPRFRFINDKIDWSQMDLGSYDELVCMFTMFDREGLCFLDEPNHIQAPEFLKKFIVINTGEQVLVKYSQDILYPENCGSDGC